MLSRKQLQIFSRSKRSSLESIEDIELLRFIELGIKIKLVKVSHRYPLIFQRI